MPRPEPPGHAVTSASTGHDADAPPGPAAPRAPSDAAAPAAGRHATCATLRRRRVADAAEQ